MKKPMIFMCVCYKESRVAVREDARRDAKQARNAVSVRRQLAKCPGDDSFNTWLASYYYEHAAVALASKAFRHNLLKP